MSESSYKDQQLSAQMKDLRAAIKSLPIAKLALERVERRLRYVLRVLEEWDAGHAERAETLIRLGKLEAANGVASLIFDTQLRAGLYRRSPIIGDTGAGERVAEAIEMGREVLT